MHITGSKVQLQHNITCTVQTEILHSCNAVPHNTVDTPQIASYRCCIALPCGITCTVQIEILHSCNAVQHNRVDTPQIASYRCCIALLYNLHSTN